MKLEKWSTTLFVALVACAVVGCDGGGGGDADVTLPDGCTGCIDSSGACLPGDAASACGSGGATCDTCEGEEQCVEGSCGAPPACGPHNCDGCCGGDECVPASAVSNGACGRGGGACNACPTGGECVDGECVLPCSEQCRGCCDEEGACQPGDQTAACGMGGGSCAACGGGESCSRGTCIGSDCGSSCEGCCSGDSCLGGDSATACGTGGAACVDCGSHRTCAGGACVVEETSRWDVIAIDGTVPEHDAAGETWDIWGGLPDPFVRMVVSDDPEDITDRCPSIADTTSPSWLAPVLSDVPARALAGGIRTTVLDEDYDSNDPMGECTIDVTEDRFDDTPFEVRCADGVGWTINVRIRPH